MLVHPLAIVTWFATLALVALGGLVHATGSSLACPDWPTCFGTLFPEMVGGVLYEHSHRILGTLVGALTLSLTGVLFFRRDADRALRFSGLLALGIVVFQGVLGGATVLLRLSVVVSTLHLATSQIFLLLMAWIAVRTRPAVATPGGHRPLPAVRRSLRWAIGGVYVQMLLGALVRHTGAKLACGTDFPLCNGLLLPTTGLATLQTLHRVFAFVVMGLVFWATLSLTRREQGEPGFVRGLALGAQGLVSVQILLGIFSVTTALAVELVTLHLVAGALLLTLLAVLMFLRFPRSIPTHLETGAAIPGHPPASVA